MEHVTGQALDRKVFVECAHHLRLWLEQHGVVGVVGNRAAGSDRRQRRAALAAQHAVHCVAVQIGRAPATPRVEAIGEHAHHFRIFVTREVPKRRRAPHQRVQIVFAPLLQADLCDDLLGQHVERFVGQRDAIQLAARH